MIDAEQSDTELARVADLWSAENSWRADKLLHWTQHPKVQERLNFLTSGSAGTDRFEYIVNKYFRRRPVRRALTLGCGHGHLERGLCKYNFAKRHDGIDIAGGAITNARRLADAAGLTHLRYAGADLNRLQLPRYEYDAVFGISSIHHVAQLEQLLIQVSQCLKPNGYFILDEYVGPNQFQWPDEQLAIVNEQIDLIPERLRTGLSESHCLKGPMKRHTLDEMNEMDPSEAIRATDIIPHVSYLFDVIEIKGYGGSLLHLVLEDICGNFNNEDEESMKHLDRLFKVEDELIGSGRLQHDFVLIVARKRTSARTWIRYTGNRLSAALRKQPEVLAFD